MRHALRSVLTLAILASGAWSALFVGVWIPGGAMAAWAAGIAVMVLAAAAVLGVWRRRYAAVALYGLAVAGLAGVFAAIAPRNDRDWAPDVARPVTATVAGDRVDVENVRDFAWRTETEAAERWEPRRYDLRELDSLDLINSYWSGRTIAHTLLSFGFRDGRHLAFSVEIRRERDEAYSNVAGFFRRFELITVAAEERDIVRLRTSVRREDVELYRVKARPDQIRAMFLEVLRRANAVAATPAFYDSLRMNCTTAVFGAARAVAPGLPFDWRIILSGHLPDYAYDQGLIDTRLPLDELRRRGAVSERGRAAGDAPDFSARIREGIPDPNR